MNETESTGIALKEETLHRLPHRCPYCDQVIDYDRIRLKEGENPIQCPACKKTYIKIVSKPCKGEICR